MHGATRLAHVILGGCCPALDNQPCRGNPEQRHEERHAVKQNVIWLDSLSMNDVGRVGGKNASLGEMISGLAAAGVKVPGGFATTADAYYEFLGHERPAAVHP